MYILFLLLTGHVLYPLVLWPILILQNVNVKCCRCTKTYVIAVLWRFTFTDSQWKTNSGQCLYKCIIPIMWQVHTSDKYISNIPVVGMQLTTRQDTLVSLWLYLARWPGWFSQQWPMSSSSVPLCSVCSTAMQCQN